MGRFHLELTDKERMLLIVALCKADLRDDLPGSGPTAWYFLAERISNLPDTPETRGDVLIPRAPVSPTPPGTAPEGRPGAGEPLKLQSSRPAPSNSPRPMGSKELVIPKVDSIVKSSTATGERLHVKWEGGQASCWDSNLFTAVLSTVKQPATFYVNEVKRGNALYLNIVGVK